MKKICKKIIPIFIIAMFFLSFTNIEYAAETNLKIGDINGDGEVNTLDRILVSQHIAASRVPEIAKEQPTWVLKEEKIKAGDINGDGEINPLDRMRVSEYIAATRVPEIAKENPTWKTYIESKWEVEATGITINPTTLSIIKGKLSKLTATIQPSNVTNKIVTWSSSDTKVATVDGIGNVTAKDTGITIITATTKSGKSAKCEVKVTPIIKNISTLNTTLSTTSVTYNGKAQTPAVTVKDGNTVLKNGTNYTVAYNKNVNVGTATATVTGKGNYVGTTTKTFKINKASYNINSIRFANSTITYDGKAHSITATGIPAGVKVTYTGNGKINAGTYTITARFTGNGTNYNTIANKTAVLRINPKPVTTLSITGITDKMYTGKAITQSVVVKYGSTTLRNGTDYTVSYRNNVNVGTASVIITGKRNYSGAVTKTFRIKEITPTSITLTNTSLTIEKGNTKNMTATVYPSNATNKKVNWYSSNTNVATINSTGKVTAKSAGTCYVTAVTVNGKKVTCKVTVNDNSRLLASLKYAYKFSTQAGGHVTYIDSSNGDHRNAGKLEKGYSDCSHFVHRVFEHTGVMKKFVKSEKWGYHGCPNTTDVAHFKKGQKWDYSKASPGDVIWEHYGSGRNNHVYIYLGNGKKIGCSSGHGKGKSVNVGKVHRADSSTIKYERKIIHFNEFPTDPNSYFDTKTQTIKYK